MGEFKPELTDGRVMDDMNGVPLPSFGREVSVRKPSRIITEDVPGQNERRVTRQWDLGHNEVGTFSLALSFYAAYIEDVAQDPERAKRVRGLAHLFGGEDLHTVSARDPWGTHIDGE